MQRVKNIFLFSLVSVIWTTQAYERVDLNDYGISIQRQHPSGIGNFFFLTDVIVGPQCDDFDWGGVRYRQFINNFKDQIQKISRERGPLAKHINITVVRENCMGGIVYRGFPDVSMEGLDNLYVGHKSHKKAVEFIEQLDDNLDEITRLEEEIWELSGTKVVPGGRFWMLAALTSTDQYLSFLREFKVFLTQTNIDEKKNDTMIYVIKENFAFFGTDRAADLFGADIVERRKDDGINVGHRSAEELVNYLFF